LSLRPACLLHSLALSFVVDRLDLEAVAGVVLVAVGQVLAVGEGLDLDVAALVGAVEVVQVAEVGGVVDDRGHLALGTGGDRAAGAVGGERERLLVRVLAVAGLARELHGAAAAAEDGVRASVVGVGPGRVGLAGDARVDLCGQASIGYRSLTRRAPAPTNQ
jgi:hypothetical protein